MEGRKASLGKKRINNGGSTLIVVLVAVSFLTVIAAIIFSVSSANLRMKQIEYQAKQNFYVDEIGLDDVYNGIGKDVSKALSRAYSKTLIEATSSGAYPTQKAAYIAFAGSFYTELKSLYGNASEQDDGVLAKLNSYISRTDPGEALEVISYDGITIVPDGETGADLWQYIFENVKVKYIEEDKYEAVITTDIVIEVPYIDFFQDFTQVLDYSLIGNKGITFRGTDGANAQCHVEGNVYAGIDSKENNASYRGYLYDATYDGMNFYKSVVTFKDSGYLISRGDFNICESSVTIDSKVSAVAKEAQSNLYAENIRTVENAKTASPVVSTSITPSVLKATANVFVADDLELSARNSNVVLSGNYYGYNFNNGGSSIYETWEKGNVLDKYSSDSALKAAHTTSSSIVVNGNHSTLDLSDLNTLMVAGVAYVDIKDQSRAYADMASGEGKEYRTGESVAMRYNQFMYLAPADILEGVSNPQLNGTTDAKAVCPSADNSKLAKWFGSEFLDKSGDSPVIPVVYTDKGTSYTYYYLRIQEGKEAAYAESFMSASDPGEAGTAFDKQKWELKQLVQKKAQSASIASHITLKPAGSEGETKIYTTGLLTDTGESKQTFKENDISLPDMAVRSGNFRKHYVQLYVNLDPNSMTDVEESKRLDPEYPLKNFLKLDNFGGTLHIESKEVEGVKDANVWILEEVGGYHPVLDLSSEKKKGIVLCDGDLTIKGNGGSFEGLILATGKITVTGNVEIRANRGIVQAVLEAEQKAVMEKEKSEAEDVELSEYASYYFENTVLSMLNDDAVAMIDMDKRVTGTEYTDYIYYKNWQKGEPASP